MIREKFLKMIVTTSFVLLFLLAQCGVSAARITESDVRAAWEDVCQIAEIKPLPLSIKEDKAPNAWVTAGKSVTVTTALMELLERREEIFGVLSHEAGHAVLKHYEDRVNNAAGVGIAALLLGRALGGGKVGEVAVGLGANLATAGFSREQEVAADDFAVDLAFKGGIDPTGLYTALERLAISGGKTEPNGFNSHPPDERRLKHVRERILAADPNVVIPEVSERKKAE
jgi:putative metalloprotease